jgi:uncharacterized protein
MSQATVSAQARNVAMVAHISQYAGMVMPYLNWIIPVAIMIYWGDDPYVRKHAAEALNFQITTWLAVSVAAMLTLVCVGWVLMLALIPWMFIPPVLGALAAADGRMYEYPANLRFLS